MAISKQSLSRISNDDKDDNSFDDDDDDDNDNDNDDDDDDRDGDDDDDDDEKTFSIPAASFPHKLWLVASLEDSSSLMIMLIM